MDIDGYDAPIGTTEEDVLQRWGFAREIAELATSAPKRWPIRIGVYGGWGTGKSSVLSLCSKLVTARGHVPAFFNPWGYTSAKQMLVALADAALGAMSTAGLHVDGAAGRGLKKAASTLVKPVQVGIAMAQEVESWAPGAKAISHAGGLANQWLDKLLAERAKDFLDINRALGEKRLVVFVDDVDRTDPVLLPKLLFALHEVIGQPGISYVVALDPAVVAKALSSYHPGFGTGTSFLEKIIQFPRWIPEPAPEDLAALAMKQAHEYAPFFPEAVIRSRLELLPKNPRALRTEIRNLWTLRAEIDRHDPDEIDWHLILIVSLIRSEFPALFHGAVLGSDITMNLHRENLRATQSNNNLEEAQLEGVLDAITPWVPEEGRPRAASLILALVTGGLLWSQDRIRDHAFLAERPAAITTKEYRGFLTRFSSLPTASTVDSWMAEHCAQREVAPRALFEGLFREALKAYRAALEEAADSEHENRQLAHVASAEMTLRVLRILLFELQNASEVVPHRFRATLSAFRSWAHFEGGAYRDIRANEHALLLELVKASAAPDGLLEELAPWDPSKDDDRIPQQRLNRLLIDALVAGVARRLEDVFERPSGINTLIESTAAANRWVLFHPERYWKPERIATLQLLVQSNSSTVIAENSISFLEKLVDARMEVGRWGFELDAARALLRNVDLVMALWRGAEALVPNLRFFRRYQHLKESVEGQSGLNLPQPRWWNRVHEEWRRATGNQSSKEASTAKTEVDATEHGG